MQNNTKRKRVILSAGWLLAVILMLAGGLPRLRLQPGESLHLIEWFFSAVNTSPVEVPTPSSEGTGFNATSLGDNTLTLLIILFWLMLIFSTIYAIIDRKFRRELIRMFIALALFVVLLPKIVQSMTQFAAPVQTAEGANPALDPNAFPTPPPFVQEPPAWVFILVNGLLLVVFFGGTYFAWKKFHPRPDAQSVIVREVKRALSDLEAGGDLWDVVTTCYAQMCQGLQESRRIQRKQAMTPREFEDHLARVGIASTHISQLTRLFESVRYGARTTTQTMEHEAVQCLQAILQDYVQ
ncbi:MAG: DUF4129 domain-containing protein [Anaerolineales bacterium]|nr:DUF4129 domain-containing protein [Anaerolineales bacterium]